MRKEVILCDSCRLEIVPDARRFTLVIAEIPKDHTKMAEKAYELCTPACVWTCLNNKCPS